MNRVLLVGCGHMGSALLNAWMNLKSVSLTVIDPLRYNDLKQKYPDIWSKMFNENKLNGFEDIFFDKLLLKNNLNHLKHKYLKISDFNSGKKFINKINDYKNTDILNIVVNFV